MKYISALFVAIALLAVGTVNAQNASKLNNQSYTYAMKEINGNGEEIVDQLIFSVGKVTSAQLGKSGFTEGKVIEKNSGAVSDFELNFKNASSETYVYKGRAEGATIDGTVTVTDANGKLTTMAFRGSLTEEWNNSANQNRGMSDEESQKKMKEQQIKQ